jgi:hypothetical protein
MVWFVLLSLCLAILYTVGLLWAYELGIDAGVEEVRAQWASEVSFNQLVKFDRDNS